MSLFLKRPSELCQKAAAVPADMLETCFAAKSRQSETVEMSCHHALGTRGECSGRGGGLQTRITCCSRLLAALVANPEPLLEKLTAMSLTFCASIRCNVNVMLANLPARWLVNMPCHARRFETLNPSRRFRTTFGAVLSQQTRLRVKSTLPTANHARFV